MIWSFFSVILSIQYDFSEIGSFNLFPFHLIVDLETNRMKSAINLCNNRIAWHLSLVSDKIVAQIEAVYREIANYYKLVWKEHPEFPDCAVSLHWKQKDFASLFFSYFTHSQKISFQFLLKELRDRVCSNSALYSGGLVLKSQGGNWLFWMKFFVVSQCPKLCYECFLPYDF